MADLTRSTFAPLLNTTFQIHPPGKRPVPVELIELSDPREAPGEGHFFLLFRGPATPVFPQSIHEMSHPQIGVFALFLVPVGRNDQGALYEAVFNRLQEGAVTMAIDPYLGEIMMFGGSFPPRGWAYCDGQLLSIAQNSALFSILGATYGGDGQVTFALPDLRGRVPMHVGSGPGLAPRSLGEQGGAESVALTTNQMPIHNHGLQCSTAPGDQQSPAGSFLAKVAAGATATYVSGSANASMHAQSILNAGASQAHANAQPFLAVSFCIALEGVFPPRN